MANQTSTPKDTSSLISGFNRQLLSWFLVLSLIAMPLIYMLTKNQAMQQAQKELTLLSNMVTAIDETIASDLRPHFNSEQDPISPGVSAGILANKITARFSEKSDGYYFKLFSDNPTNLAHIADSRELRFLKEFITDDSTQEVTERGVIDGQPFLLSAKPIKSNQSCLACHGDPAYAPDEVIAQFGSENGFGWKPNQVVAGTLVGVPLSSVSGLAVKNILLAIIALAALFLLLYYIINAIVQRRIIGPLSELTQHAKRISYGQIDDAIYKSSDDEIGELAKSFELMRRSVVTLGNRVQ